MHELLARDRSSETDSPHPVGIPGKFPTSARLSARTVVFRHEAAGAPDAAPAAEHAHEAVARAGAGDGQPLPTELQTRFESSLGTDLSGVRVHTGAESAAAAKSIHARAYATGNDIHFAAGAYQPSDPFGVHLLAHEVVHTVQQAGAAPSTQTKLEVSSPGDACEVEAETLAARVASGEPVGSVSRAQPGPAMHRTLAEAMGEGADNGEKYNVGAREESAVAAGKMSNVGDAAASHAMVAEIVQANAIMTAYVADGPAEPSMLIANTGVIETLRSLGDTQAVEGTNLGMFQTQYATSVKDYDRIIGAVQAYQAKYPGSIGVDFDDKGKATVAGGDLGAEAAKNLGASEARRKILKDSQGKAGDVTNRVEAEKAIAEMSAAGAGVKAAQDQLNINTTGLQGASAAIAADIGRVPKEDDKKEGTKLKAEMASFKSLLSTLLSAVKFTLTHVPDASVPDKEDREAAGADTKTKAAKGTEAAEKVDDAALDKAAAAFFAGRQRLADAMDGTELAKKEFNNSLMYVKQLEKQEQELTSSIRKYKESTKLLADKKAMMMKRMQQAGKEADRVTGNPGGFEAASRLTGECMSFLQQADVTLHHAGAYDTAAGKTDASKTGVTTKTYKAEDTAANPASDADKHGNSMTDPAGMRWYSWNRTPAYKRAAGLDKAGRGEIATNHVDASALKAKYDAEKKGTESGSGPGGARETTAQLVEDLSAKKVTIGELKNQLVNALGLFGNKV